VGRTGLNLLFSIQPPQEAGFIFAKNSKVFRKYEMKKFSPFSRKRVLHHWEKEAEL
jgi:hypothetical protein